MTPPTPRLQTHHFQTLHLQTGTAATLSITTKMGSLGPVFWEEFSQALTLLSESRVLVLRGGQNFSAGLDLKATLPLLAHALSSPEAFEALVAPMHGAIEALAALPIPVIAAIDGWCIGAGLELAAAADFRICSAQARFSLPEVRLGMVADLGGLSRLPRLIGAGRAAHLALTAEPLSAEQAERWGLVTEVLPDADSLFARAEALAHHLTGLPPLALEGTKQVLRVQESHQESLRRAVRWNAQHLDPAALETALR